MRMTLFTVSRPGSRDDGYAALIWQIQSIPEATFHTFRSGKFEAGSPNVSYRNKFRTNNNGRVKVKSWSTKNSLPGFATQVASWRPSGRMSALIPSLMDKTPIDEVENVIQYDNLLEAAAH